MTEIKIFIKNIKSFVQSDDAEIKGGSFWTNVGVEILSNIDSIVDSGKVNIFTSKDYSKEDPCILEVLFDSLTFIPSPNEPFPYFDTDNTISYYELAYSRCCSYICQLLGDRLPHIQKLLIKYLFSEIYICSILASDLYVFIMRIIHPNQRMAMCQIIMNLCKLAPPDALVKGVALVNRLKHPVINFENPRYQHILNSFS